MAKGASKSAERNWNARRLSPVNTDDLEAATYAAEQRVREIQTKLHRWARDDPHRRFDDLFNLVADPGFLSSRPAVVFPVRGRDCTASLRSPWNGGSVLRPH
jgi:hypothetical protein